MNSLDHSRENILSGDFNSNWLQRSSLNDHNLFNSINLTHLITESTRVCSNSASLLDWILVTHPDRIIQSGVLSDSFSDHSIVFCVWKIRMPHLPPKCIKVRKANNINPDLFNQDILNTNWETFQLIPSVEDAWHFFYTELLEVINKHASWSTIRVKCRHLPWIKELIIKNLLIYSNKETRPGKNIEQLRMSVIGMLIKIWGINVQLKQEMLKPISITTP